ncbi:competence type IV pilus minor pilin ComGD [Halalkalibacterium ligniniphilum]|uniref:competence type IV pilus minor pilin ComGD n=1 Tax=Halalkalibacterium ligniniphilum TaxID=1134413 RepID=UPI00034DE39C|nr:competence type IV pilus minor pilin ComGD [Halalkalibacterium ligniniphilum]
MKQTPNGYTLVETLIAFMVLTILVSIPLFSFQTIQDSRQADYVARLFKEDILYAQHLAMTEGKTVSIFFNNRQGYYELRHTALEVYVKRDYLREDMEFAAVTLGNLGIEFNANGNAARSGTLDLLIANKTYRYTVQIGKGRVTYVER